MTVEGQNFALADWWQFKVLSVEGLYMMAKLKDSVLPPAGVDHCVIGMAWDSTPLYLLSKKFYTAAAISAVTGIPADRLERTTKPIEFNTQPGPIPTVSGWGTA